MNNLKKVLIIMIVFCMVLTSFNVVMASESSEIKVKLDGEFISFDTQPQLIGGRTMVPLRAIFEALGATVNWDEDTQTVTSYNEAYLVKCTIGKNEMNVNNEIKMMDVAPMTINDRTLVPARFVAEAFDCKVDWDADKLTVIITSKAIDYSKIETPTSTIQPTEKPSTTVTAQPDTSISSKGTLTNPYSADDGEIIIYQEWSQDPQKKVSIKCTNVIRGTKANDLAQSENMFNNQPNSSQEWCFLEFDIKYISSNDGKEDVLEGNDVIYDDTFFDTTGSRLNVSDMAALGDTYKGYGVFDTEFYPGGSGKVVIGILINKNVGDILLRVPNKTAGTNTWIKCTNGNNSSTSTPTNSSSDKNKSESKVSYSSNYPGTTIPTYTSVTGVTLKSQDKLSDGTPVYMYRYTDANDVADYWNKLSRDGWKLLASDDDLTSNVYESCYVKGSEMVILNIYWDFVEVWITH